MSKRNTHVNIKVQPKKDEPFERMLKRFMKKVKKERIIELIKQKDQGLNDLADLVCHQI